MSELEVIAAVLGGLAALVTVLAAAGAYSGVIEGGVSLRIVPPRKRRPQEAAHAPAGQVVALPENRSGAA